MLTYFRKWGWIWSLALTAGVLPVLIWTAVAPTSTWQPQPPDFHALSSGEQGALVLAVYFIKLVYMLVALAVLALIWREHGRAWLALQGSLAAFWLGEFFCAINILFFVEEALVFEYLHSLFMVFCLGLLFFSVMEVVDKELLHFSNPSARCALVGVCKNCVKAHPGSPGACLLHRLFQWMIPLGAVVVLMPLIAQPMKFSFETSVFGVQRILTHLMPIQWYEVRFSPAAALVFMAAAWLALAWRGGTTDGVQISKILLSVGAGHLGFSLMRLAFASFYRERLVWFVFWEELTELLLVVGVLVVVVLIRPGRFARLKERFLI